MIPWIYDSLRDYFALDGSLAEIMRYGSTRAVCAFIVSFLLVLRYGGRVSCWLYRHKIRDHVRDHDEFYGRSKSGTPTMGGILIVGATLVAALLFCNFDKRVVPLMVITLLFFGGLGAWDDWLKVRRQDSEGGLSRRAKLLLQITFASIFAAIVLSEGTSHFLLPDSTGHEITDLRNRLFLPFPSPSVLPPLDLGIFYGPFIVFVMVAIANAINFADGLDGLAVLPSALTAAVFGLFAYLMTHRFVPDFDVFKDMEGLVDISIFAAGVVGSCVGFLWFNAYPAQVFMGDTGSQALGGSIAAFAILSKQELLFLIAGGLFVFEAASVLVQDTLGIRFLGRRIFFRSPAHHGFQYRGVAETKVVLRFWIVSLLCAVLSVATLKLR